MKHFDNISDYISYVGLKPTEHPQLHIFQIEGNEELLKCVLQSSPPITTDFYTISLKRVVQGSMSYGRTQFDFKNGSMIFGGPQQVVEWNNIGVALGGFSIIFHEDFIKGTGLAEKIKDYGFFDYSTNEALHLSSKEEEKLESIYNNIAEEYNNNQDEFSKEIIISQVETILKYSDRFYKRQFINRKELNSDISRKFKNVMAEYVFSGEIEKKGIPRIDWIALQLKITSRYLSDSLKTETGRTAVDSINLYLIDEAKQRLLEPNSSISETAYQLGFEYPQYFSRLFKKKVGVSPKEYIETHSLN